MKRVIFSLSFSLFALLMYGQITLEECQRKTRENYPLVRQYGLIEKTKEYNLANASKGYLPQFTLSGKASWQSEVTELLCTGPRSRYQRFAERPVSGDAGTETEHLGRR